MSCVSQASSVPVNVESDPKSPQDLHVQGKIKLTQAYEQGSGRIYTGVILTVGIP